MMVMMEMMVMMVGDGSYAEEDDGDGVVSYEGK